ncbi:unnamed protein product, partial [Nesidiocoris tenuis]
SHGDWAQLDRGLCALYCTPHFMVRGSYSLFFFIGYYGGLTHNHHGGIPGVFNCRFTNPYSAAVSKRKKKKPTSFVPPPSILPSNHCPVPFWCRPLVWITSICIFHQRVGCGAMSKPQLLGPTAPKSDQRFNTMTWPQNLVATTSYRTTDPILMKLVLKVVVCSILVHTIRAMRTEKVEGPNSYIFEKKSKNSIVKVMPRV